MLPDRKSGIRILNEIAYQPGQKPGLEDVTIIPFLANKVSHGISIGPAAQNMAEGFERDNIPGVTSRIEEFLKKLRMSPLKDSFLMIPSGQKEFSSIDITEERVQDSQGRPEQRDDVEFDIRASAFFTTEARTPLMIKPADCPSPIIYVDRAVNPVLGIMHAGRDEINRRFPEKAIAHLVKEYECDPKDILVGIPPGISPDNYFIRAGDSHLLEKTNWENHVTEREVDGEKRLHLDLLGNLIAQFARLGIPYKNIEAYGHEVDTYELTDRTPPLARSQRYSTATNQPQKNGRILVVASL